MFIAGACSSYEYLETISKRLGMSISEYRHLFKLLNL